MLYLFKVRKLGALFGPWATIQENGSSSLCEVVLGSIQVRNKHKQEYRFFFYRMPYSCIVFGCNNKSDSENGRVLHRIPFFNDHCLEWVRGMKKNGSMLQSITAYACFVGEWNPEMTSQNKLGPFSVLSSIGQKSAQLPSFEKVQRLGKGKIQGQKLFCLSKQGSNKSVFRPKVY